MSTSIIHSHAYLEAALAIRALQDCDTLNAQCYNLIAASVPFFERESSAHNRLEAAKALQQRMQNIANVPGNYVSTYTSSLNFIRSQKRFIEHQILIGDLRPDSDITLSGVLPGTLVKRACTRVWENHAMLQPPSNTDPINLHHSEYTFKYIATAPAARDAPLESRELLRCLDGVLTTPLPKYSGVSGWLGDELINYCFTVFNDCTSQGDKVKYEPSQWINHILKGLDPRGPKPATNRRYTIAPLNWPLPKRQPKPQTTSSALTPENPNSTPIAPPIQPGGSGTHWTCLWIDHAAQTYTVLDSMGREFTANGLQIQEELTRYLQTQFTAVSAPDIPLQTNNKDCGVFTIMNAWAIGAIGRPAPKTCFPVDTTMWRMLIATMALQVDDSSSRVKASPASGAASKPIFRTPVNTKPENTILSNTIKGNDDGHPTPSGSTPADPVDLLEDDDDVTKPTASGSRRQPRPESSSAAVSRLHQGTTVSSSKSSMASTPKPATKTPVPPKAKPVKPSSKSSMASTPKPATKTPVPPKAKPVKGTGRTKRTIADVDDTEDIDEI